MVDKILINVVYEYLISLIKNKSRGQEFIDKKKEEMKKKIQDVITDLKNKKKEYVFEKNKKEINDLFLDLFYDSFLLFKKGWSGLTEDQKKQKDYFRYLEEKLNSVDGIASNTNDNGLAFKELKDLNESQKDKMRPIINNSFIVGPDDDFVAPAVYEDTFEFDSYRRFYYEIMNPAGYAGGSKKITRRVRPSRKYSVTKNRRRSRHSRRRTSRKPT